MSIITKQDTDGVKPLLSTGELGYDNYPAGGDEGRVYVGTGTENIALAKKTEVIGVDGKADAHIARIDNPHNVTKAQVGLANVDNTSDANKPISTATQNALNTKVDTSTNQTIAGVKTFSSTIAGSINGNSATATKLATARTINGVSFDGTANIVAPTNLTIGTRTTTEVPIESSSGTNASIPAVTTTLAGVMSSADKVKLDGIATGATANTGTVTSVATSGAITGGTITSTGTISHSTADGYLHVPATGTTNNGKVLTAGATAGSLSWTTIPSASVTSVAGKTGVVTLVKGDVGLGSVDNTADSTKNVLSATKLTTARTINGVSFDGSANITVADSTKAPLTGAGASGTWGINITGNAATATTATNLSGGTINATTASLSGVLTSTVATGTAPLAVSSTTVVTNLNADKVDGYDSSALWRSDGGTWNPSANIALNQTANNQEWSFDITRNGYTGGYWHVWDSANSTMLKVDAVTGKVSAPYNFVGNLEGNAATATNVSGGKATVQGIGNDYYLGGVELRGNGPANTVFPTIGFHQPELYASSLQLRGGGDFRFYTQGGGSYANVTANTFIGNLSGNATTAGRAYPRRSDGADLNFYWSGQGGQPTWLWGGNDGANMYVYNPSNFSVNYATSATYAATAAVGTNDTQIATTAFVQAAVSANGANTFSAGTKLEAQSLSVVNVTGTTYTKVKEICVANSGIVTVSFRGRATFGTSAYACVACIFKNGTAVGTVRTNASDYFITYTENISVNAGDLIQLYIRQNISRSADYPVQADSFKILVSNPTTSNVIM